MKRLAPDFAPPDFAALAAGLDSDLSFDGQDTTGPVDTSPAIRAARITRRPTARRCVDLREHTDAARRLIRPLPLDGESVHALLDGSFVLAAIIPAVLDELGEPAAVTISTLGTNDQTAALLCDLLKTGKLTSCRLLISHYFEQADKETCHRVVATLRQAGQLVAVARCHCKLMLFEPAHRPDRFVIETSANLRSAVCLEQLVLSNDRALFDFHSAWIEKLMNHKRSTT